MKTNKFKVFLNIFLALSLAYVASACDSNYAHPDLLKTDDSIKIDDFYATPCQPHDRLYGLSLLPYLTTGYTPGQH